MLVDLIFEISLKKFFGEIVSYLFIMLHNEIKCFITM